jgi:hypothetical protein
MKCIAGLKIVEVCGDGDDDVRIQWYRIDVDGPVR